MTTLHDRLADLADDAPQGAPAPDLWERGVRHHRRRVGSVVIATAVAVMIGVLAATSWSPAQRTPTPAGPERGMRLPDHIYAPSSRLPGTDEAGLLGPVSAILYADRNVGFRKSIVGVVGVSATTGEYRFLDLPAVSEDSAVRPSPDGRHLAYGYGDQQVHGIRVYDTTTGETSSYGFEPGWELAEGPVWVGDDVWFTLYLPDASHRENDSIAVAWKPGEDRSQAEQRPSITKVEGDNVWMQDLPYLSRGDGGTHGLVEVGQPRELRWWTDLEDFTSFRVKDGPEGPLMPVRIPVSPSGDRLALVGRLNDQTGVGPIVVAVPPGPDEPASSKLVPGIKASWVRGWRDDDHVVTDRHGEDVLRSVDVDTGQSTTLMTFDEDVSASFADDAWAAPMFEAPRPHYPPSPVLIACLGVGFALILGLTAWRRRVRP